jgi:hypothetical protein
MEACYGGTDVMKRSCAVARGIDINSSHVDRLGLAHIYVCMPIIVVAIAVT